MTKELKTIIPIKGNTLRPYITGLSSDGKEVIINFLGENIQYKPDLHVAIDELPTEIKTELKLQEDKQTDKPKRERIKKNVLMFHSPTLRDLIVFEDDYKNGICVIDKDTQLKYWFHNQPTEEDTDKSLSRQNSIDYLVNAVVVDLDRPIEFYEDLIEKIKHIKEVYAKLAKEEDNKEKI